MNDTDETYATAIRALTHPLTPQPTEAVERMQPLEGLKAVLFDVYGTMLISASGDVGTSTGTSRSAAFEQAVRAIAADDARSRVSTEMDSGRFPVSGETAAADGGGWDRAADLLIESIHAAHRKAQAQGIEYPEVDIVQVWKTSLQQLVDRDSIVLDLEHVDFQRLALEYEMRVNPTWPMPGVAECIRGLTQRKLKLGIISNAQFFTELLFPALLGNTVEQLGFDSRLLYYSYRFGLAKPSLSLYEMAAEQLSGIGVSPHEVLFIGNDLLNDVMPASRIGFRTALFAGDKRSLRTRREDPRVADVVPDLVLTELAQLIPCIDGCNIGEEG